MDYLFLIATGLSMGLLGGLLGIGGSVIMIPAMVFIFGENQHLYQASAMICNFFIGASAALAHKKAQSIVPQTLKAMIPAAIIGIVLGVAISNSALFAGGKSYLLAHAFGAFLVYVAIHNSLKFSKRFNTADQTDDHKHSILGETLIGLITGLGAGLLGMGAGTVSTPLQQILLKMPLRRAMSNSAVLIMSMAWLGAIYKNLSLEQHETSFAMFNSGSALLDSLKIAGCIVPVAIVGALIGGHLMHKLPKNLVRSIFIIVVILAALRLLAVQPNLPT
jgi:uncharacterized membrane protein YfcA